VPTVRYTSEGGRYRVGGETFEPGDVHDVPDGLATHLVDDVGEFEYVDDAAGAAGEGGPAADDVHEEDGPPDEDGDDDGTDDDLAAILADMTIPEFEEELESGRFDDRLDAVAKAEAQGDDRAGIHDVIGVRRAEIEE